MYRNSTRRLLHPIFLIQKLTGQTQEVAFGSSWYLGIWWAKEAWFRAKKINDKNIFREGNESKASLPTWKLGPLRSLLQNTSDWTACKQQKFTAHSLGAGSLRSKCHYGQESALFGIQISQSLHMKGWLWSLLVKALIPLVKAPLPWISQRTHLLIHTLWG